MNWQPGERRDVWVGKLRKLPKKPTYRWHYTRGTIPAPYDRIICQLTAEDAHGDTDMSHESQRRQLYARQVLDEFGEEFKAYKGPPDDFRSHVLSPILARQLAGIPDSGSPSIMAAVLGEEAGEDEEDKDDARVTIGMATDLYLSRDPTGVELIPSYRYNSILLPTVRWHLAVVLGSAKVGDPEGYDAVLKSQDRLMASYQGATWRGDVDGDAPPKLCRAMVAVLVRERLQEFFLPELSRVVQIPQFAVLLTALTSLTSPPCTTKS